MTFLIFLWSSKIFNANNLNLISENLWSCTKCAELVDINLQDLKSHQCNVTEPLITVKRFEKCIKIFEDAKFSFKMSIPTKKPPPPPEMPITRTIAPKRPKSTYKSENHNLLDLKKQTRSDFDIELEQAVK